MADSTPAEGMPHLPPYVAIPGETDMLFVVVAIFVVGLILALGIFYFRLHALPEQMAHKGERTHMQLVAMLALIALFTHNNIFWIAALLLAAIEFPSYELYFRRITRSLEKIAGIEERAEDRAEAQAAKTAASAVADAEASAHVAKEG